MAKQQKNEKAAAPKAAGTKSEENFVTLMMVAAEFAQGRGGIESAKQALQDTGRFIEQAGSVGQAARALEVLESLKTRIGT